MCLPIVQTLTPLGYHLAALPVDIRLTHTLELHDTVDYHLHFSTVPVM